jgi:putative membrane protein
MLAENAPAQGWTPVVVGLLVGWALLALAFAITSALLPGMDVSGGFWGYVWVSAVFGLVNGVLGTILRILTLPLTVVTLGLFSVLVNAVLLSVTDALSSHLTIDEFWWTAIWAAIVLALVSIVLELVFQTWIWRKPGTSPSPRL